MNTAPERHRRRRKESIDGVSNRRLYFVSKVLKLRDGLAEYKTWIVFLVVNCGSDGDLSSYF